MQSGLSRFSMVLFVCLALSVGICLPAGAKVPEGYRDIKLGMNKDQVLDLLQKSPVHFSYDDLGDEIGEIIRGDDLFRYATYKFDSNGTLIEIGLQMREILGRDRCIEMYNNQHGLKLSPAQGTAESDLAIEVKENTLLMRKTPTKDTRSAAKGS